VVLTVAASATGIVLNAVNKPYAVRQTALAARLQEVLSAPPSEAEAFQADYAQWKSTIEGRAGVWDSLVPPPAPKVAPPDPGKEMAGISVLKGSAGSGVNAKVRLSAPGNERGKMFKVGDAVTPNVTVKEVTANQIIFDVKVGGQTVTHPLPR
jgi:hypothetical protein